MKLFQSSNINGKLALRNRLMMPPLVTRLATTEGHVTDELIDRYARYASGGVGLNVTEAVSVKKQKSGPLLRISDERFVTGLTSLTARVHAESEAKIAPQLIHFLKLSRSGYRQKVEDLSLGEIREIPTLFARAAGRAQEAGFDAVELHFAHAYTMSSFLSRHNRRPDQYGGSLENRLRLGLEVLAAVRATVGDDFVIGARINGDEFTRGGNSLEQSRGIAIGLAQEGIDYLSISAGGKFEDAVKREGKALEPYTTGYSGSRAISPAWMPEGVNVYLCAAIRAGLRAEGYRTTTITAGRIPTAHVAERILAADQADMVAVARPLLCDPHWPNKYASGRDDAVLPCLYCNACTRMDANHQKVVCVQWQKSNGGIEPPSA